MKIVELEDGVIDYQEKGDKNENVSGNGDEDGWDGGDKRAKGREGEHIGHRHCYKKRVRVRGI